MPVMIETVSHSSDDSGLGVLAYDISEAIAKNADDGYRLPDIGQSDIEPNLPAFLAACQATADGVPVPAVQVEVRDVYGTPKVYPANSCARLFAKLTRTKTFRAEDLDVIRELGFDVTMARESLRLPDGFGDATVI